MFILFRKSILALLVAVVMPLASSADEAKGPAKKLDKAKVEVEKDSSDKIDPTKPRSLFDGKTLTGWNTLEFGGSGVVEVEDAALTIGEGVELSGVQISEAIAKTLPLDHYEVAFEARKVSGYDFFAALTFPVTDLETCATLVVGGWGGGVVGISSIDGFDASDNNSTIYRKFEEKQWYKFRLRVSADRLQAWIDDKRVIDEDIRGKKISLRSGQIDMCAPFGFATFQTDGQIRKLTVRQLTDAEKAKDAYTK